VLWDKTIRKEASAERKLAHQKAKERERKRKEREGYYKPTF
jgi:hypothetical protein